MKKIILLFLALAVLGAFAFYYYQKNIFSLEEVPVEILGPREVTVLEEVEYIVQYRNNSDVRLEDVRLIFEYPEHAVAEGGGTFRKEVELEDLLPGQERITRFPTRLLGKEGELKIARAFLSYRPGDLQARFESETSFTSTIATVPVNVNIDIPSRIPADREFTFKINYSSSLDYPLTDLRLKAQYPPGFEVTDTSPEGLEETEWEIPVLNMNEGGTIEVSGIMDSSPGEGKVFSAQLGTVRNGQFIVVRETSQGAETAQLSLLLGQRINGEASYAPLPGEVLHYEISFKNIGDEPLSNMFMVVQLEGEFFDFETIRSDAGKHQRGTRSITFNWSEVPNLERLLPQEEGSVEFFIKLHEDIERTRNPSIRTRVLIEDEREEFTSRVGTNLTVAQRGYYFDEVFGNSGPLPPQVGSRTTYTVFWEVKNFHSDVRNTTLRARLPSYVTFTGQVFPQTESSRLNFDEESRELTWDVGEVNAGTGVTKDPKTVVFQISFIPTEAHRGTSPVLVEKVRGTAQDLWAERPVEFESSPLSTELPDDSEVTPQERLVQ